MENLVVLTSSGTSVSAGGKTMANLETAVFETIENCADLPASVKPIIAARTTAVSYANMIDKPVIGFEGWLCSSPPCRCYKMADAPFKGVIWPATPGPTVVELQWFVDRLRMAIFAECALSLRDTGTAKAAAEIAPQLTFFSKLVARDSNLGRTHLFTLNYDTLFEQALEILGIQYFDGFTGRAEARFDPSVYGLDVYYPGEVAEGRVRRFDRVPALLQASRLNPLV